MKLSFGRGKNREFNVNPKTDYLMDNGSCIQLVTKDLEKGKWKDWSREMSFVIPKNRFDRLLKSGFVELANKSEKYDSVKYYCFTEKVFSTDILFK